MARLQLPNPPASSEAVRASMRGNRARDTGPERRLRRALRRAGFPGYRLNWRRAPGRPDIAYPGRLVAIFVHGCYWHRCPSCHPSLPASNTAFWARKFELNVERDSRKRADLERTGWRVVEAWECAIRDDADGLARDIGALLDERAPTSRRARAGSAG